VESLVSRSATQTARRRALSSLATGRPTGPGASAPARAQRQADLLGDYVWRRFFADVPWDERLLRASAGVRRGARAAFTLTHGAWSLSLSADEAVLAHWVYGDDPVRLPLAEFERRVESSLEPCQACAHQARFPRLRGWSEYRLRDGAAVFMCPECTAAAVPAAA
jgi:hypothetical protein